MPRRKSPRIFPDGFDATPDEIRFGTPIEVAEYRAKRLACDTLLEIGCGVGFQTLYFAKYCKKVIAVEIVPERLERAKANLAKHNITNVEFHAVDALDKEFIKSITQLDIIFCDPGRPPSQEKRSLDNISPHPLKVLEAYKHLTQNVAYELPPHLKTLPEDTEVEYIALHGELNRLMLYWNDLKQHSLSLLALPQEYRLEESKKKAKPITSTDYIGEPSPAVLKAGLLKELGHAAKAAIYSGAKSVLLGDHPTPNPLIRWYKVLQKRPAKCMIVLHYPIAQGEYQNEKKKLSIPKGKRTVHVFKINSQLVFTQRVVEDI